MTKLQHNNFNNIYPKIKKPFGNISLIKKIFYNILAWGLFSFFVLISIKANNNIVWNNEGFRVLILIFGGILLPFYFGFYSYDYCNSRIKNNLSKGGIKYLIIFTIGIIIIVNLISYFKNLFHNQGDELLYFTFIYLSISLVIGFGAREIFCAIKQNEDYLKYKSELNLLKNQINPHFLFNTLHNIDTLITENPDKASDSLIKLSEIMRYMTYDVIADLVPLEKEINHIYNFIELQKLRFKNSKLINFKIVGDVKCVSIPPMLFIPFVENAFKHVTNKKDDNGIIINFEIKSSTIIFRVENVFDKNKITNKDKSSGIGLKTVIRRLELLYPINHKLIIDKNNNTYSVLLKIYANNGNKLYRGR